MSGYPGCATPRLVSFRETAACCGLDLGCSRTRAVVHQDDGEWGASGARELCGPSPTAVAFTSHFLIGKDAAKEVETRHANLIRHLPALLSPPRTVQLVYKGDSRVVTVDQCIACVIQKLVANTDGRPSRWVMAVHNALSPVERQRMAAAASAGARFAGGAEVELITSPLAVGVHYANTVLFATSRQSSFSTRMSQDAACPPPPERRALIIDAGCRFTSISVVRFATPERGGGCVIQELAAHGLRTGGHDITVNLAKQLDMDVRDQPPCSGTPRGLQAQDKQGSQGSLPGTGRGVTAMLRAVESAKHELSSLRAAVVKLGDMRVDVSQDDLAEAASAYVAEVESVCSKLCREHSPNVALMVGGSSRLTALRKVVTQLGLHIEVMDTDHSCAIGCAEWAARRKLSAVEKVLSAAPQARFYTADRDGENVRAVAGELGDRLGYMLFSRVGRGGPPTKHDVVAALGAAQAVPCESPTGFATLPDADPEPLFFHGHVAAPDASVSDGPGQVPCGITLEGSTVEDLLKVLQEVDRERARVMDLQEAKNLLEEALIAREDATDASTEGQGLCMDDIKSPSMASVTSPGTKGESVGMLMCIAKEWVADPSADPAYSAADVRQLTLALSSNQPSAFFSPGTRPDGMSIVVSSPTSAPMGSTWRPQNGEAALAQSSLQTIPVGQSSDRVSSGAGSLRSPVECTPSAATVPQQRPPPPQAAQRPRQQSSPKPESPKLPRPPGAKRTDGGCCGPGCIVA
eukprot:TRINITY_DN915_c7_g1_i1.p1 TRINITY_DN915_c7_g1~~TRINITY_DN915_c7_g1_i1.p1  ORF type:complete len:774 (+),score=258.01 TRINITY_DN915_c7_g1_i1:80-2323(+)